MNLKAWQLVVPKLQSRHLHPTSHSFNSENSKEVSDCLGWVCVLKPKEQGVLWLTIPIQTLLLELEQEELP